jgi:hypothetical protein
MDGKPIDIEGTLENGLGLRAAGWSLLIFDAIFVVWVWTGLRAGSWFWVWWVLVQFFIGVTLLGVGIAIRSRIARIAGVEPQHLVATTVLHPRTELAEEPRAA